MDDFKRLVTAYIESDSRHKQAKQDEQEARRLKQKSRRERDNIFSKIVAHCKHDGIALPAKVETRHGEVVVFEWDGVHVKLVQQTIS